MDVLGQFKRRREALEPLKTTGAQLCHGPHIKTDHGVALAVARVTTACPVPVERRCAPLEKGKRTARVGDEEFVCEMRAKAPVEGGGYREDAW